MHLKDIADKGDYEEMEVYIDDIGATSSEAVREYLLSKDKKEFLAMCKMYNAGLIKREP